jgi:hypothetical protein
LEEAFVKGSRQREAAAERISAEAIGTLVAFLDTDGFSRRRGSVVRRLQAIRDSDRFATLPEDLRERLQEIVTADDR